MTGGPLTFAALPAAERGATTGHEAYTFDLHHALFAHLTSEDRARTFRALPAELQESAWRDLAERQRREAA